MNESVVNEELMKVCEWLKTNKLSLNTRKSNFVISHPFQRKPDYNADNVTLKMYDNDLKILSSLKQKHYVKYLGVLIDSHLSWRYHIDYISSKISKGVGIIARLRHYVPTSTLLSFLNRTIHFLWTNCMGTSCQFKSEQNCSIAKTSSTVNVLF